MFRRAVAPAALVVILPLLVALGGPGATATTRAAAPSSATASASVASAVNLRRWAPGTTTPARGPSFNNPNLGVREQRRNLDRIYRYVESTPGYRVRSMKQCPRRPRDYPNHIKIALYSFSDNKVADALIRAHRRCINVQVLMNSHLTNRQVPAFGRLQKALGKKKGNRSFARRCSDGCRGMYGPLHSKIFLFTEVGRGSNVVVVGSSNMTGKAANVQWNDLFVFRERQRLYDDYDLIFREMKADRIAPKPVERNYWHGKYLSMFWPQPGHTKRTDRVLRALKEVRCDVRPTGRTGYAGRTGVAINIHAMEGDRGYYLAGKIVRMHKQGCRVRVLYGLIAPRIHRRFKEGGVPTRRTIFDRDDNGLTEMYTHMKVLSVNGVVGDDTAARVVYTGSENFSHRTVGADEVWVRIPDSKWWRKYQDHFDMIWRSDYYSNPRYAHYTQSSTPIHARTTAPRPGAIVIDPDDLEL